MSLTLIATPIGNVDDISVRALKHLKSAEIVIGEDKKVAAAFLKSHSLLPKQIEVLNEHSDSRDIASLMELCQNRQVALITDCGTPGFCDPGFQLVSECRNNGIEVSSVPGASSLMMILSLAGSRVEKFVFDGFVPRDTQERGAYYNSLGKIAIPHILLDTPYRFQKVLVEVQTKLPNHRIIVGIELTKHNENVFDGLGKDAKSYFKEDKAEFIILVYPAVNSAFKPVHKPPGKPPVRPPGKPAVKNKSFKRSY